MGASLWLASSSPRRRDLLQQLGIGFEVDAAHTDESIHDRESPEHYVQRIARTKATTVALRHSGALVLAADTSVVLGNEVLGKPDSAAGARSMLERLSGSRHRVLTAVALVHGAPAKTQTSTPFGVADSELIRVVTTDVYFKHLSSAEIEWYVKTEEPLDKAGAYAIQGMGGSFVKRVEGSVSNVVGLPLVETLEMLTEAGHPLPWNLP